MKVIVVYDSVFGNTKKVAQGICSKFEEQGHDAQLVSVTSGDMATWQNVDLFVLGSPTRAFNPTKPMKVFIKSLVPEVRNGAEFAVFDTRMDVEKVNNKLLSFLVKFLGYANDTMEKMVKKHGGKLVGESKGFFVKDSEGPLYENIDEEVEAYVRCLI